METEYKVGDLVKWVSSAGHLYGKISKIFLALNAKNEMIPWMIIKRDNNLSTCLPNTKGYLKMMKFESFKEYDDGDLVCEGDVVEYYNPDLYNGF